MKIKKLLAAASIAIISGCTSISAKQPYQSNNEEQLLITANMINGKLEIFINTNSVIKDSILNFGKPFSGNYEGKKVTALCKHTKHFFSTENECDVFINNKFAANLYLR
jgi:hypothetical protein